MFTFALKASAEPVVSKACGGPAGLSYIAKMQSLVTAVQPFEEAFNFKLEPVITQGGGENVQRVASGDCAIGIAPVHMANRHALTPQATLFQGYGHLVCKKAAVGDAKDIWDLFPSERDGKKLLVAVGGKNSASFDTWKELGRLDSDYIGKFAVINTSFTKAIAQLKNPKGIIGCAWAASGIGSAAMRHMDFEGANDMLTLINVNDKDFNDGKNLFFKDIPSNTYPKLQGDGWISGDDVETVVSDVVLVVNQKWATKNPDAAAMIIGAAGM